MRIQARIERAVHPDLLDDGVGVANCAFVREPEGGRIGEGLTQTSVGLAIANACSSRERSEDDAATDSRPRPRRR